MLEGQGIGFLLLNASIVWAVLGGLLMWLLRMKALVALILLAPFVIGSSFRHVAGMPELIGLYGTSLLYGAPGLVLGVLYADYQRAKAYFSRVSKSSFLARGGIALSSVYIIGFYGQKIIFENPMVQFLLGFSGEGRRVQELVSQLDSDGVIQAGACIALCFGVLAFNRMRESRAEQKALEARKDVETS